MNSNENCPKCGKPMAENREWVDHHGHDSEKITLICYKCDVRISPIAYDLNEHKVIF